MATAGACYSSTRSDCRCWAGVGGAALGHASCLFAAATTAGPEQFSPEELVGPWGQQTVPEIVAVKLCRNVLWVTGLTGWCLVRCPAAAAVQLCSAFPGLTAAGPPEALWPAAGVTGGRGVL